MLRRHAITESPKMRRMGGVLPATAPVQVRIREAGLTEKNVKDLENDSNIAGVGLIMPTRLIEPVSRSKAAGEAPAWGVSAVGADRTALDGAGVTVAMLDTGIDRTHPAFASVNIEEMDFGGSGNGDKDGHGTHCAGTIFGKDVHGTRIGVARNVKKTLVAKVSGRQRRRLAGRLQGDGMGRQQRC
jgi:subtilisin family serine protease